jgi:hypothetical protein
MKIKTILIVLIIIFLGIFGYFAFPIIMGILKTILGLVILAVFVIGFFIGRLTSKIK